MGRSTYSMHWVGHWTYHALWATISSLGLALLADGLFLAVGPHAMLHLPFLNHITTLLALGGVAGLVLGTVAAVVHRGQAHHYGFSYWPKRFNHMRRRSGGLLSSLFIGLVFGTPMGILMGMSIFLFNGGEAMIPNLSAPIMLQNVALAAVLSVAGVLLWRAWSTGVYQEQCDDKGNISPPHELSRKPSNPANVVGSFVLGHLMLGLVLMLSNAWFPVDPVLQLPSVLNLSPVFTILLASVGLSLFSSALFLFVRKNLKNNIPSLHRLRQKRPLQMLKYLAGFAVMGGLSAFAYVLTSSIMFHGPAAIHVFQANTWWHVATALALSSAVLGLVWRILQPFSRFLTSKNVEADAAGRRDSLAAATPPKQKKGPPAHRPDDATDQQASAVGARVPGAGSEEGASSASTLGRPNPHLASGTPPGRHSRPESQQPPGRGLRAPGSALAASSAGSGVPARRGTLTRSQSHGDLLPRRVAAPSSTAERSSDHRPRAGSGSAVRIDDGVGRSVSFRSAASNDEEAAAASRRSADSSPPPPASSSAVQPRAHPPSAAGVRGRLEGASGSGVFAAEMMRSGDS